MTVRSGPSISTNGLVFCYDMFNPRSWQGEPTSNLCINNTFYSNWNNSGTATWNSDDRSVDRIFPSIPVLSMNKDTTGNSHISHGRTSISAGLTYTVSTHIYIPGGPISGGAVPYIRTDPANTGRGTLAYNGDTNWNNWPRDRWIRISQTFTNTANDTALYISCYLDNAGDKVYYTAPQVEQKSYRTPYTGSAATSRSNTQSILDLTNNNTITANSLTYDSGGTFSFNGSNSISFPNPLNQSNLLQEWTVHAWVNITHRASTVQTLISGLNSGIHLEYVQGYNALLYLNGGANDYYTYGYSNGFADRGWCLATFRFKNSTGARTIWRDVTEIGNANGPNNTSTPSGQSATFTLGGSVLGSIGMVSIYNRYLTDSEVKTNFIAGRGRYGL